MSARRRRIAAVGTMAPPPVPIADYTAIPGSSQQPLPPSSIAVIFQNLPKTGNGSPGPDFLQQLFAEVISHEVTEPTGSSTLEDTLLVNYKVITAVVDAGVSVLLREDPFAPTQNLTEQASNSLLVLRLTIKETPEVLFRPPPESTSESEQPLLYLWLLSKLLPLLGHRTSESLVQELLETIYAIFDAAANLPQEWKSVVVMVGYFRSCLELPEKDFTVDPLLLPEDFKQFSHQMVSFTIRDADHAAFLVLHLFSAISALPSHNSDIPTFRSASDSLIFFVQEMQNLWMCLNTWESLPALYEKVGTIRLRILETLANSLEDVVKTRYGKSRIKSVCLLAMHCIGDVLSKSISQINQSAETTLAKIILGLLCAAEVSTSIHEALRERIYPSIILIMSDREQDSWGLLTDDIRVVMLRLVINFADDLVIVERANKCLQLATQGKWVFKDEKLQEFSEHLHSIRDTKPAEELDNNIGPRKRPRLSIDEPSTEVCTLTSDVYKLLGQQDADDLQGLSLVAVEGFEKLDEEDRCTALKSLGFLSCALAGTLTQVSESFGVQKGLNLYKCSYCDADTLQAVTSERSYAQGGDELFKTLEVIQKLEDFQASTSARVWAMISLRRLLNHTQDLARLDLAETSMGKWCLNALHSSRRLLRVAAGRTLPSYVNFKHGEELLRMNRIIIIEFLRTLSDNDERQLQETCVLAWSQFGRVSSDEELNLTLIRLVEYLGHSNSFILGLAYNEIQSLARAHGVTPGKMFLPFWSSISVGVVKQLQSKPQIAQLVSEVAGMELADFLKITQSYTVPYLILWKRPELVERVAQACKINVVSLALANMAQILALLLTQEADNVEVFTLHLLAHATGQFKNISLGEVVRPEAMSLATDLLKAAVDADEGRKTRIFDALRLVASLTYKKVAGTRKNKEVDYLEVFFEMNVLGIFATFNDYLKDMKGKLSTPEKIRILRAIEEMMKLARGGVSSAVPQICACLQEALELEPLRASAFSAWTVMMRVLGLAETAPLLGQTFSVVLRYWDSLEQASQTKAMEMTKELFERKIGAIEQKLDMIPSLAAISTLAPFEERLKAMRTLEIRDRYHLLARRCRHENVAVVEQALVELSDFLKKHQDFIHTTSINEQPDIVVAELMRTLLDVIVAFKDSNSSSKPRIEHLCAECLGLIGAVDPNRVEAPREKRDMMVLHNFDRADESIAFVVFFLEEKLVKAFLSATDTKAQGFLAFGMQELLKFIDVESTLMLRSRNDGPGPVGQTGQQRWDSFSQTTKGILTPFLTSRYSLQVNNSVVPCSYPIFSLEITHRAWLTSWLTDLLSKSTGNNATNIFRGQDTPISTFLLPYVTLNVIVGGTDLDRKNIVKEIHAVLAPVPEKSLENPIDRETLMQCSDTVFQLVDHLTRWLRDKKQFNQNMKHHHSRQHSRMFLPEEIHNGDLAIARVEDVISAIPSDTMSLRSVECNSYARALFYWEQYIRNVRVAKEEVVMDPLYEQLQRIYTQIDEPDGIEGISAKLHVLNLDQQILEHRKAGRWTAAQSWYEILLSEKPDDNDAQINLLECLRESGQHEMLLSQAENMMEKHPNTRPKILRYAVEAAWISGKWDVLERNLEKSNEHTENLYELRVGNALHALRKCDSGAFTKAISLARECVLGGLTESFTSSLRQCHESMVKLHALSELEEISNALGNGTYGNEIASNLRRRLDVLGTYSKDKQHLLALRRAAYVLSSNPGAVKDGIASTWLIDARLARKNGQIAQSFNSVLHASRLGAPLATVEHAKLLWLGGQHRKAISNLEGAIASNLLQGSSQEQLHNSGVYNSGVHPMPQNYAMAKASLLLARWLDGAGQTHSDEIVTKYCTAKDSHVRWEQGHYYLGRHYNKLYEVEKALPPIKQTQPFLTGEYSRLVIQNYLRALMFGTKYIYQTMPRLLTLWLTLGEIVDQILEAKYGNEEFRTHIHRERGKCLKLLHSSIKRYSERLPSWVFFTALPQILSRITHPQETVWDLLQNIIVKVVAGNPQQALWALPAVCRSTNRERANRGLLVMNQLKDTLTRGRNEDGIDVRNLILQANKLTDQLLLISNADLPGLKAPTTINIKEYGFNHKCAPCALVVPTQVVLTITLPSVPDTVKTHSPFPSHQPTIFKIEEEADVMNSLQKPRKIKIRGTDGRLYGFLCKPKDDLRKDARLMEFNNMINRFLKKDPDSSQRRMYIRTYSVTPLNEECGLIEWVNGVRTLREILLAYYKSKKMTVDYPKIRQRLEINCSDATRMAIFTDEILPKFPPVFHEWFAELFSEPSTWFASRLAYARTSAVMSMVGYVLGLGDRHGENILFDESNGDTLHVDFNCLFDKGLSFEKPEKVPFRLTQNMVDALGVTGYEGVFRRTCENAMRVLRHNEDTLLTLLETFIHDPAVDMVKKVRRKPVNAKIPDTPKAVLESIQGKLQGLYREETVPLSVEGQVQQLLKEAVDPANLCAMYIGWCAFF
ncbi:hypothetical protein L873DRAFT_1828879 [Choiromyces venosus 120613-1]|uniref:Serine/threonine-protein kinase MEC1 n=1 Tax=Choiromyces venosus 120613-1 TaxID=1336337 RepID=A0A3N4JVY1_9PEZI|nr:hypothetical protein L873DRAFT_1828879 [Choiromyces venosus 120613-1]